MVLANSWIRLKSVFLWGRLSEAREGGVGTVVVGLLGEPLTAHETIFSTSVVWPEKWDVSQVGFRGSNASGDRCASTRRILGARCFQNGHFGHISSSLYFTVFESLEGHAAARRVLHKPCFSQAHCFMQGPLRFLPVPPNPTCARSHVWGFPILGWGNLRFTAQITGFSADVSNPQGGKPTKFWISAGKCHLLRNRSS